MRTSCWARAAWRWRRRWGRLGSWSEGQRGRRASWRQQAGQLPPQRVPPLRSPCRSSSSSSQPRRLPCGTAGRALPATFPWAARQPLAARAAPRCPPPRPWPSLPRRCPRPWQQQARQARQQLGQRRSPRRSAAAQQRQSRRGQMRCSVFPGDNHPHLTRELSFCFFSQHCHPPPPPPRLPL